MSGRHSVLGEIAWVGAMGAAPGTPLGSSAGLKELGCLVFELDPGGQAAPYHLHHGNEELPIVLDAALELRAPDWVEAIEADRNGAGPRP
jgi:uncharacterized cupin superfamily protein